LAAGQDVRITVDAFPGETFIGHVSRVGAASDPAVRSLAFEALVANEDHRLRPGFFGHGEVVVRRDERALAVPRSALSTFAGVTKLFVIEDGVASVEEMETGVTKVIEEAVNTIDGIDELRSITKEGLSSIVIQFVLEKSRDTAAQDVRDKVATVLAQLPVGTDPPVIDKFDVDAIPVMGIALSGRRNLREVTELARRQVKEDIETLAGVGQVLMLGGQERAINISVDPDRLTAQGLSIGEVRDAIQRQNLELPGGRLDQTRRELVVRTMGRVERAADFGDLIVARGGERPLRVRDIGTAEDGIVEP